MFVDPLTDFNTPPYQLPSLTDLLDTFNPFADREERLCLIDLLGRQLYDDLIAGLAMLPAPEAKWSDLAIGAQYEYLGKKYNWAGLDKLLIPYIYRKWSKDQLIDTLTSSGVSVAKLENADVVSPSRKLVQAQNEFATIAGHCRYELFDTLYGYLYVSGETYKTSYEAAGYTSIRNYLDARFNFPGLSNVFNI